MYPGAFATEWEVQSRSPPGHCSSSLASPLPRTSATSSTPFASACRTPFFDGIPAGRTALLTPRSRKATTNRDMPQRHCGSGSPTMPLLTAGDWRPRPLTQKHGRRRIDLSSAKQPGHSHHSSTANEKQGGRALTEGRLVRCPWLHVYHVTQLETEGATASGGWASCGFEFLCRAGTWQDMLERAHM